MVTKRKTKSLKKRGLIISLLLILLVISGVVWNIKYKNSSTKQTTTPHNTNSSGNKPSINYNPPTQADIQQTDELKNSVTNPPKVVTTTDNSKKKVTPMISNADSKHVSAYVLGVFEEGGTCTATVTQGSLIFSRTSKGFENSSYTQCTPIDISTGGIIETQKWSLTVSYNSSTAEGTSSVATITP